MFCYCVDCCNNGSFCVCIRNVKYSGKLLCGALCPVTMWWQGVLCSKLGFNARNVPSSTSSSLRVSSFLFWYMCESNRLEADTSGVLPAYPKKTLRSGFWTSLMGPCPVEPVTDLRAVWALGVTIFIHRCRNFVMRAFVDSHKDVVDLSSDSVVNFVFYDLVSTWAVINPFKIVMWTIGLLFQFLIFHNIHSSAATNNEIVHGLF